MGQKQISPYTEYEKEYTIVSKNENDDLLIRHKETGKQFMLRKVIVKSEQELEQRLKLLNKRRKIKNQHLLHIVDFKPFNHDRICGNTIYVSLLIEYPFESLFYETLHRLSQSQASQRSASRLSPLYFQEHELWSILYSCALGLEALYLNDMPHQSISKSNIFIDKEGVVKFGDPIILGARTNYEKVIELRENEKRKKQDSSNKSQTQINFYQNDKNLAYLKKLNKIKEQRSENRNNQKDGSYLSPLSLSSVIDSSCIVSPELISLCKDHKYYFFDKEKSDVFCLGAVLLELALLENVASYDPKNDKFKTDLSEFFASDSKLVEKYSPALVSLIQSMIKTDPKLRPTLSEIVQKIEEFSIQQNTNSEQNSVKKTSTDLEYIFNKNQSPLSNYNFSSQLYPNTKVGYPNETIDQYKNKLRSAYIESSSFAPVTDSSSFAPLNTGTFNFNSTNKISMPSSLSHQFPSFSLPKQQTNTKNLFPGGQTSQQSALKPLFQRQFQIQKNFPIEIKYTESPLMIPLSSVRNQEEHRFNYTPFNNLNLTESNEKKTLGKTVERESIVQTKYSLFGPRGISGNALFSMQANKDPVFKDSERFSLNNFGKIQIPTLSNNTSIHTSTIPTPRFQNSFNTQANPKLDFGKPDFSKPIFPSAHLPPIQLGFPTYEFNHMNKIHEANSSLAFNGELDFKFPVQKINGPKLNASCDSNYDPKRQGFSISDNFQDLNTKQKEKLAEPYYANSSVGYTLPKYRPESTSSEVVRTNSVEKVRHGSENNFPDENRKARNGSPSKNIREAESILQKPDSPVQKELYRSISQSSSMINKVMNLANDKSETISNKSSQNTVKKQSTNEAKGSNKKKYNFYKQQLYQKLQKVEEPNSIDQISIIEKTQQANPSLLQRAKQVHSPIQGMEREDESIVKESKRQHNLVEPMSFSPQLHSVYVEENQDNGSYYKGYKLNGKKNGTGLLVFADNGFYEGQFNNDAMQGEGVLYYNEKDIAYEGQFLSGNFHGHGVLYNHSPQILRQKFDFANLNHIQNFWVKYDGYFKNDQKSGKCTVYFTNGERFQGFCQNNTFEGNGRFFTLEGEFIDGIWKNNVLIEVRNQGKTQDLTN